MEPTAPNSLSNLLEALTQALAVPTTSAAALPTAGDLQFERTLSRPLGRKLDAEAERVLGLAEKLLKWTQGNAEGEAGGKQMGLDGEMIVEGVYSDVIERVEGLLEGADEGIERHLGIGKAKAASALGAKLIEAPSKPNEAALPPLPAHLLNAPNLARPQLLFPPRLLIPRPNIDDQQTPLWKPVLRTKLHATDPAADWLLEELYTSPEPHPLSTTPAPPPRTRYQHPYKSELSTLVPPAEYFVAPIEPTPFAETSFEDVPFLWVGSKESLDVMIEEIRQVGLKGKKDLAVDLEHHGTRTWSGMTSLLQLSTREKDYVVDTLEPEVMDALEGLNEFFADPTWIKVFHGAASDIIWLQRDLGLYIIGLFDTYHATHVLSHPQHSLASLLSRYTTFIPDKRYQMADWRIRPVPTEMLHYARSDTHFLLSIYDHLRLALHALPTPEPSEEFPAPRAPLDEVFFRSIDVSSKVFEVVPYDHETGLGSGGWRPQLSKWRVAKEYEMAVSVPSLPLKTGWGPGEVYLEVLRALHYWREKTAREIDESAIDYVMTGREMEEVVRNVPRTELELMAILGKAASARHGISKIARQRKSEIMQVIEGALEKVTIGTIGMLEVVEKARTTVDGERGVEAIEPAVRPLAGLWGSQPVIEQQAPVGIIATTSSSMFGTKKKSVAAPVLSTIVAPSSLIAKASAFLGKAKSVKAQVKEVVPIKNGNAAADRLEAVARVHASLVLGGGLADSLKSRSVPIPVSLATALSETAPASVAPSTEDISMDHSYIPFSDRLPVPSTSNIVSSTSAPLPSPIPKPSDVIIVSSLADKPKKRRRAKEGSAVIEGTEVASTSDAIVKERTPKKSKKGKGPAVPLEGLEPFDYSTVKSVLDAEPEVKKSFAGGKKDKKKEGASLTRVKGFEVDTSAFRKQPRVNNMSKKGNVSASFEK